MQLHCLGTAGYHPNEERHTSCYFLPKSGIVLDAGTGLFRLPSLIETPTLDILLSHAHLDHIAGLTFLLDVLFEHPVESVRIWGERIKLERIQEHLFAEAIFPVTLDAEWCPIDDQNDFQIGDVEVTWRPQTHPGGSVGYRLDWKRAGVTETRLLYLTDTIGDLSDEASRWYADADLMMHECYFTNALAEWATKTGHTWTGRLAEIVLDCAPKKALLTHINPIGSDPLEILHEVAGLVSASAATIELELAHDRQVVSFGSETA